MLLWQVQYVAVHEAYQCWVCLKEAHRSECEADSVTGHDWIVLRTNKVSYTKGVPHNRVSTQQGAVLQAQNMSRHKWSGHHPMPATGSC